MVRTILHVDMDAFYASVEERDRPELKDQPLIVGGTSGRGVVAAANYAVRQFGVRSAMPLREALRLCPHAICIPPRMTRYKQVSAEVFEILRRFTPLVEGLSLDEAYLDVTRSQRLFGSPEAIGAAIKAQIRAVTLLPASVGIGTNKLLAKLACELGKPDGLYRLHPESQGAVLDALPIERLPGIGPKTAPGVKAAGIHTFGDLRQAEESVLWRLFGRQGKSMQRRAAGIDERAVDAVREEKSISAEETFAADIRDPEVLETQLIDLADRTAARLRAHELAAGRVTVKIRSADFTTCTRQCALRPPTQDTAAVSAAARRLWRQWSNAHRNAAVRLLGVGVGDLRPRGQADLFETAPQRDSRLDAAVDGIRHRFGTEVLTRASLLPSSGDTPGSRRS